MRFCAKNVSGLSRQRTEATRRGMNKSALEPEPSLRKDVVVSRNAPRLGNTPLVKTAGSSNDQRAMRAPLVLALTILITGAPVVAQDKAGVSAARPLDEPVQVRHLDGRFVGLSELKEKVTIVNFWASWCFPCRYEMPLLQNVHNRFEAEGLTVIAIGVDDEFEAIKAFQDQYKFKFPVVFDGPGAVKKVFGVNGVPETYIVGHDGALIPFKDPKTLKESTLIDDPTVWESPEIIEFLDALLNQ